MPKKASIDVRSDSFYIEDTAPQAASDTTVVASDPCVILFNKDGAVVAKLDWSSGVLKFEGDLDWAARALVKRIGIILKETDNGY